MSKAHLDTIVARRHPSILDFDGGRRVCKLALSVWSRALIALELAAHFQLQPT